MSRTAPRFDLRVGEWQVQPALNRLRRADEVQSLPSRFMDLLVFLAENGGRVMTKEEITEGVWGKGYVSDGTLTHAIAVLRQALGDDSRDPSYIETIPTRGYRLIAEVAPGEAAGPDTAGTPARLGRRVPIVVGAAASLVALIAVGVLVRPLLFPTRSAARPRGNRIAVLPFRNLGAPDRDFLASGITDDLTTRLASVEGLAVASRISAESAARDTHTAREIGEELGADYLLVGTVRWEPEPGGEGQVWVNAQLLRAASDSHAWVARYHRPMAQVFEIETNIAAQVLAEVGVSLPDPAIPRVNDQPTTDIDAYQAYLCAVRHQRFDTLDHLGLAAAMLERAVALDGSFALALADLSVVHSRIFWLRVDHSDARLAQAKEAADRALALQPDLPEAHRALGAYYLFGFRDYEKALAELRRAADAFPHDSELVALIADVRRRQGRWREARDELQRALDLDPRNYELALALADTLSRMRDYAGADRAYQSAARLMPDNVQPYLGRFWNGVRWAGMTPRTLQLLEEVPEPEEERAAFEHYFVRLSRRDFQGALAVARLAPAVRPVTGSLIATPSLLECLVAACAGDRAAAQARCRAFLDTPPREAVTDRDDPRWRLAAGYALAAVGDPSGARDEVHRALAACPVERDAYDGPAYLAEAARVLSMAGANDEALAAVERVLAVPSPDSPASLRADPRLERLRADPRFEAALARASR